MTPDAARQVKPHDRKALWNWVHAYTGVKIARSAVCLKHSPPFDLFAEQVLERPSISLWHAPRGSGKSFLSAIDTHIASRFNPIPGTRIRGGSTALWEHFFAATTPAVIAGHGPLGSDADSIKSLLKTEGRYQNGSKVAILAASPTSVRGPHIPSLKLDEVDEIDPDIRESALGMVMEMRGHKASVLMTSTWHRVGGPMADLIARGEAGAFNVRSYCVFEVLERCPEERSGKDLERCPECPLVKWCHSERHLRPDGLPKAKLSDGHYTIDSLIQKTKLASDRVFESDFLCLRPKADGIWFSQFDETQNVGEEAEYDPMLPVHLSVDSGVWTGAVLFQVREVLTDTWPHTRLGHRINVFADYLSEDRGAGVCASDLLELLRVRCGSARYRFSTDSAGGARNPVGTTVFAEYLNAGIKGSRGIENWPKFAGSIADGLKLVEAMVRSADGTRWLTIHPRCRNTIEAFKAYRRAKRANQVMDYPEDPQHPHEDLIDAIRGGLKVEFPESQMPEAPLQRQPARRVF